MNPYPFTTLTLMVYMVFDYFFEHARVGHDPTLPHTVLFVVCILPLVDDICPVVLVMVRIGISPTAIILFIPIIELLINEPVYYINTCINLVKHHPTNISNVEVSVHKDLKNALVQCLLLFL